MDEENRWHLVQGQARHGRGGNMLFRVGHSLHMMQAEGMCARHECGHASSACINETRELHTSERDRVSRAHSYRESWQWYSKSQNHTKSDTPDPRIHSCCKYRRYGRSWGRRGRTWACASRAAVCMLASARYTRNARCGHALSPGCAGACSSRGSRYGAASGPSRCSDPMTTTWPASAGLRVSLSSKATTATFRAAVMSMLLPGWMRVLIIWNMVVDLPTCGHQSGLYRHVHSPGAECQQC